MAYDAWNTFDHSKTPPDLEALEISLEPGDSFENQIDQLVQENLSSMMVSEEISSSDLNFLNSDSLQDPCHEPLWQGDVKQVEPKEMPPEPLTFSDETSVLKIQPCEISIEPSLLNTSSLAVYSDVSSCSETDLDCISNTLLEETLDANPSFQDQKILDSSNVETKEMVKNLSPFSNGDTLEELDKESVGEQEESLKQGECQKPPEELLKSQSCLPGMDCSDKENESSTECGNGCMLENEETMDRTAITTQNSDTCFEETNKENTDTVPNPTSMCQLDLNNGGKEIGHENNDNVEDGDGQGECQLKQIRKTYTSERFSQNESATEFKNAVSENDLQCDKAEDTFFVTERSSFEFLQSCLGLNRDQKLPLMNSFNNKNLDNGNKPSLSGDLLENLPSQTCEGDSVQPAVLVKPAFGSIEAQVPCGSVRTESAHQETVTSRVVLSSQNLMKKLQPVVLLRTTGWDQRLGNRYHCAVCQHSTQSVDELVEHYHSQHSTHHFQYCLTCRCYFSRSELAEQHFCDEIIPKDHNLLESLPSSEEQTVKGGAVYTCRYCRKAFIKQRYFLEHERKHTEVTQHRCACCGLYFPNEVKLFSHNRKVRCLPMIAEQDKLAKMTLETILKKTTEPLIVYGRDRGMIKLYDCFVKLERIKKEEQNSLNIKCEVCEKSFKFRAELKAHLRSHSHEKPFQSDNCKQKYKWNLKNHKSEHYVPQKRQPCGTLAPQNLPKRYKCPLCERMFKHSYIRNRHLRLQCLKEYTRLSKGKIGSRFKCPLCRDTFSNATNRRRHIKNTCFKQFKLRSLIKEKEFKDIKEDAKQPKKNQLLPLRGAEGYTCIMCPIVLTHKSSFYRHLKKVHQRRQIQNDKDTNPCDQKPSTPEHQGPQNEESTVEAESDPLSCHFCEKIFLSDNSLKKHLRLHKGNKPFRCLVCGKSFQRRGHLQAHKTIHKRRIQCSVCKKTLLSIGDLLKHRQTHLTKGLLKCPDCPMQFKSPALFLQHVKIHQQEVKVKSALTPYEHQSKHVNEEEQKDHKFKCEMCQKAFNDSKSLSEHFLSHIPPESSVFTCPFCKREFQSRAVLIRHIRLHTGEKSFSCSRCAMHFHQKEILSAHQEQCRGLQEKPPSPVPKTSPVPDKNDKINKDKSFNCSYCPRVFSILHCLKLHEGAHMAKSVVPCSSCGKFYRKRIIRKHEKNCSNNESQTDATNNSTNSCKSQSQDFNSDITNKAHKDIGNNISDPYEQWCPHCLKCFRYRSQFLRHLKTHLNNKQFKCVHCGKEFASEQYYLEHKVLCDGELGRLTDKLHESEKKQILSLDKSNLDSIGTQLGNTHELRCKFCTKTFTKPRNLRRHILTHTEVKPYRCKTCESCFSRHDHLKVHQTRCKGRKQRLEVRIEKISLDIVGTSWQTTMQPENGMFKCDTCSKQFFTHSSLTRHISMQHTALKPFLCTKCGIRYSSKRTMKRHSLMEDCRKPAGSSPPVSYCRETSKLLQGIDGHYASKWKFQCEYCPRRFKHQAQLQVHTRLHTGEKPFGCSNCGEHFIRRDYLQRHLTKCKKAKGDAPEKVLCDRCGGLFVQDFLHVHQKNCAINLKSADGFKGVVKTCSPSKIKGFSCDRCSERFLLFSQLQEHFLTKHRSLQSVNLEHQPLFSPLSIKQEPVDVKCAESLPSKSDVHTNNSSKNTGDEKERPYECQQCNMRFLTSCGLTSHLRAHSLQYSFFCKKCNKGFWNKNVCLKHTRRCKQINTKTESSLDADSSEIEYTLNETVLVINKGAQTTGTGVLQTKFSCKDQDKGNAENDVRKYHCSECDQTFTDGLRLISHLEDHGREDQAHRLGKGHRCHVCGQMFDQAGILQRHLKRKHQESTKNTCPECFKSFRCPSDLEFHRTRHDPNRPFVCDHCQLRFWTAKSLCLHQRQVHSGTDPQKTKETNLKLFSCHPCNKSYAVKGSYLRHCRLKHPEGINRLNSKETPEKQQLDNSESGTDDTDEEGSSDDDSDSAPYFPCHVCGKTFLTSESLEDHQRCHLGEKPFECDECGKCFFQLINLQQHQRSHKSEFQCRMCGKGFISLFALRKHKQSHVKKRPHRCTKCHLSFTGSSQLAEHMITHRGENFPCDLCSETFTCKLSRAEHRKSHTDQEEELPPLISPINQTSPKADGPSKSAIQHYKHHCGICQVLFPNADQLSEHGCNPSKERPYSCPECNKHFLRGSHLKKHQLSHQLSGPRSFQCNRCHMSFSHRHHFLTHLRTHREEAPDTQIDKKTKTVSTNNLNKDKIYRCPICPESFSQALELANHLSVHAHMCNVCNKTFATKGELEEHEQNHLSAATQYECTECGNSFLGSETFRQHHCARKKRLASDKTLGHSSLSPPYKKRCSETSLKIINNEEEEEEVDVGEDFYNCSICSKRFTSSTSLQEHKKLHDARPYKCLVCGKGFTKKKYLSNHQQLHSERPYQCDFCSESFKTEHTLFTHHKTQHQCSVCKKMFHSSHDLSMHEQKHAELQRQKEIGEHRCDMCYKSFSQLSQLQKHQESHVGQVVYECTECEKAFAFPDLLEEHQQSHATSTDSL